MQRRVRPTCGSGLGLRLRARTVAPHGSLDHMIDTRAVGCKRWLVRRNSRPHLHGKPAIVPFVSVVDPDGPSIVNALGRPRCREGIQNVVVRSLIAWHGRAHLFRRGTEDPLNHREALDETEAGFLRVPERAAVVPMNEADFRMNLINGVENRRRFAKKDVHGADLGQNPECLPADLLATRFVGFHTSRFV